MAHGAAPGRWIGVSIIMLTLAGGAWAQAESIQPPPLGRPLESAPELPAPQPAEGLLVTPFDPPIGFAGPSGIAPAETQTSAGFIPIEDRWRIGFPQWDRYGKGHPPVDDYPYQPGRWWDPFNQNVLKGDYPIIGQHTFLEITATSFTLLNPREVPTQTTPFESTARADSEDFFGRPQQLTAAEYLSLAFDLFHGDAAFKPVDWRLKLLPIFNVNTLALQELANVNPDVRKGTSRNRTFFALEEWFFEYKLADYGPNYDFVSVRVGSQPFVSDFRGFIFADVNRAVRLFGTSESNRNQFNLAVFAQQEKDTNSALNTFNNRDQQVAIANFYRQDFLVPGYTAQVNCVYNRDARSFHFDTNGFLVRPDADGVFQPHQVDVVYLGITGDGHIGPYNITNAFYWAIGHDSLNPLANQPQNINAQFAALELSYDRDWVRFRTSFLFASGDGDVNNGHATGFDAVLDNPQFAGGAFSYWQSQMLPLFSTNLKNRGSFFPDLRASKIQGQANFVNPGLVLANVGIDFEVTPKLRFINNINLLWFEKTASLETLLFQGDIDRYIGADISAGLEYRPLLSNNVICRLGIAALLPGRGFRDIYDPFNGTIHQLLSGLAELTLKY